MRKPRYAAEVTTSWLLNLGQKNTAALEAFFVPFKPEPLTIHPVSPLVNSPRNDVKECQLHIDR